MLHIYCITVSKAAICFQNMALENSNCCSNHIYYLTCVKTNIPHADSLQRLKTIYTLNYFLVNATYQFLKGHM